MKKQFIVFIILAVISAGIVIPHQLTRQKYVSEDVISLYQSQFDFEKEKQEVDPDNFQLYEYMHDFIEYERDVPYKSTEDGQIFELDYAMPEKKGKYPLIVCLHPGAWIAGSKEEMTVYLYTFACYDYVVATVDYGLVPNASIIEQTENVLDSIEYLLDELPDCIDADNIVIIGASSGGHLGMLAAERLTAPDSEYSYDFHIKMVVAAFAPLDFDYFIENSVSIEMASYVMGNVKEVTGGLAQNSEEALQLLSPSQNLNQSLPRVLIIHGTKDDVVPIGQSKAFYQKLQLNGTKSDFIEVEDGGHYIITEEFSEPVFQYIEKYVKEGKT